jgi:hypothetical protein
MINNEVAPYWEYPAKECSLPRALVAYALVLLAVPFAYVHIGLLKVAATVNPALR